MHAILRSGAKGAVVLAGLATAIVVVIWFAFYLLVFLPRARRAMSETAAPPIPDDGADRSERVERRWATVAVVILVVLVAMATFAGDTSGGDAAEPGRDRRPAHAASRGRIHRKQSRQRRRARRLGHRARDRPAIFLHAVNASCVPTDTPVTFRATSADVVHGFLIEGTNINLMLVPGYVSSLRARFEDAGERADAVPRILRHRP